MPNYVVNKNAQSNGDYEVHRTDTCARLPEPKNQDQLGWHASCKPAVSAAKIKGYLSANGCAYCSPECHTG